jgi:hypothetical protein
VITITDQLLETLARGCDGQVSKIAERWEDPDPWEDPAYPVTLQAFLGSPPAQRCGSWLPGHGPCRHYAVLTVTIGCLAEHISVRPGCACCLGERLAQSRAGMRMGCGEPGCWEDAMIGRYVPLYGRVPS